MLSYNTLFCYVDRICHEMRVLLSCSLGMVQNSTTNARNAALETAYSTSGPLNSLWVLLQELLGLVDLRCKVRASSSVRVVEQHE